MMEEVGSDRWLIQNPGQLSKVWTPGPFSTLPNGPRGQWQLPGGAGTATRVISTRTSGSQVPPSSCISLGSLTLLLLSPRVTLLPTNWGRGGAEATGR